IYGRRSIGLVGNHISGKLLELTREAVVAMDALLGDALGKARRAGGGRGRPRLARYLCRIRPPGGRLCRADKPVRHARRDRGAYHARRARRVPRPDSRRRPDEPGRNCLLATSLLISGSKVRVLVRPPITPPGLFARLSNTGGRNTYMIRP